MREQPGELALVTANGGNLYKHVHGIYASRPPEQDFQFDDVQARIDALPARECLAEHHGEAMLESYSVMYQGEDPAVAHCACLTGSGARVWVNTEDPDLMAAMTTEEFCGRAARIDATGALVVI